MGEVIMEDEFKQWLDEQSKDRIQVAYDRAKKRDTEWWDDESFEAILMEEVYQMHIGDMTRDLTEQGLVEAHVLEDGQLGYKLTEEGEREIEDDATSST